MFFSERKLRELANIDDIIKSNEIVDAINSIGFEVEQVINFNKNKGLKFGHVLSTSKNPNSDKLTVCEVEFNDKKRVIQTAATNVEKGDYVIAFVPGSMFNGIEIKAKEMGKIISEGMLVSYPELGFDESLLTKEMKDGILKVDKVKLDLDPIEYFELDDNLIEVSILSNRSDAQSYEIFSKELAAHFQTKPKLTYYQTKKEKFVSKIKIEQNETNKLNGVEVENDKEFKLNLKDKMLLLKSNIKIEEDDIDNFSNLSMIMMGVSLRCFDLNKISNKLSIKLDKKITYLNDGKNNISILGVNVDEKYKANINSKRILFEFSEIDSKIVRDNSKNSKKVTNSSINNSRVISLGLIELTRNFIATYFSNYSQLINPIKKETKKIKFEKDYLINYAGFDITKEIRYKYALRSLAILGFKIDSYVSWPNTRHDIKNMQNIVEEIFRFYGLNNFKPNQIETKSLLIDPINPIEKTISLLGYKQAWTYTLMNKEKNEFNPFNFKDKKNLKTFVSEEYNSIRNSMALPLLNVFDYNIKRKMEKLSLFDLGMINDKKAIIIASNEKSYAQIKSDIEKIANQKFEIRILENDYLHPNYNAALYLGGAMVGWIGKFNPYRLDSNVIFAEIFEDCIYKPANKFVEFDNSPLKERDITFDIERDYENAIYLNALKSIEGIFSIDLISTFKKGNVNKLTYKIIMNDDALKKFDSIDWTDKNKLMDF